MTHIEKQLDRLASRTGASRRRPTLMFALIAALSIILIACALGRATFQSGAKGWAPQDPAEAAASFVGQ
jgi:hypothetical protein